MFISGYVEFWAFNKYSRRAVKKALIGVELKRKTVVVRTDLGVNQHTDMNGSYDETLQ